MVQGNESVRYDRRTVRKWVEFASNGEMALAEFQRSFVWDVGRATDYIEAILKGKPVGLYLILATSEEPQFRPRPFHKVTKPLKEVSELVLDGQQRLTSLLHAVHGLEERRYFIKVHDLSADDLVIETVICETKSSRTGKTAKGLDEPLTAYAANLIPIDILYTTGPRKGQLSPLTNWCIEIGQNMPEMSEISTRLLEERIREFANQCFFQRELWYCRLPSKTEAAEATEIFVATNTSSIKIKRFDIEVAAIRGRYNKDLRSAIESAYEKSSTLPYYFPDEPKDYIPEIGDWLLKVACLHSGLAPKEANFSKAAEYLLEGGEAKGERAANGRLDNVFEDLEWALRRAERWGAPTDKMIPSWPVMHVFSALRTRMESISSPAELNRARRLLKAYYWRCLFSNRHTVQANDRLHEDYRELSQALEEGIPQSCSLSAFDDQDNPLFDARHLFKFAGWITSSRLGKALVSVVLATDPKPCDWMTGEQMNLTEIRELQALKKLHRHHVYPMAALQTGAVDEDLISHGLNGVLLDQRTNLRLWKDPPCEYIEKILEETDVSKKELRSRIASHLVPYEMLKNTRGSIKAQYRQYLTMRARMFASRIQELSAIKDM